MLIYWLLCQSLYDLSYYGEAREINSHVHLFSIKVDGNHKYI